MCRITTRVFFNRISNNNNIYCAQITLLKYGQRHERDFRTLKIVQTQTSPYTIFKTATRYQIAYTARIIRAIDVKSVKKCRL